MGKLAGTGRSAYISVTRNGGESIEMVDAMRIWHPIISLSTRDKLMLFSTFVSQICPTIVTEQQEIWSKQLI
ncbi:hypothetical protein EDC54_1172 [Samsonia erythrinae]|uniref:Uncharacterized protein n=1 Tax=Samsonia erythrinae TaxID=160434 RepID=A0A4R3VB37_9GAMM|nr:hypothetical protein EDC54_1172 [Samsonia erythrinae]